jgi:hypothetical protein
MDIPIGSYMPRLEPDTTTRLIAADPDMARHIRTPWLTAYLSDFLGQPLQTSRTVLSGAGRAILPDWVNARPLAIIGKSGGGKSRLAEHILTQRLRSGGSAVVLDPKGETVSDLLSLAPSFGLNSSDITVIDPSHPDMLPGWNPFLLDLEPQHMAGDLASVVEGLTVGPAPRMRDLLENAAYLMAAHRLSFYDLVMCLLKEDVLKGVLRLPAPKDAGAAYHQVLTYFTAEFGALGRERAQVVAPVLNKIRELVKSDSLLVMLSARENTLDLEEFFHRPRLLLVFLDRANLGDQAARLLGALLISSLYRTALRLGGRGSVRCTLFIDEIPIIERLVGSTLVQIFTTGRSLKLVVFAALQFIAGISHELRDAMFGNIAALMTFALSFEDARLVATALSAGRSGAIERVEVKSKPDRATGEVERALWSHAIFDANGRALRINEAGWREVSLHRDGRAQLGCLRTIAAASGSTRLYVKAPDTGAPVEIRQYVSALSAEEFWLTGPRLQLVVTFPRPQISGVVKTSDADLIRRYTGLIQELPVQHCILRLAGEQPRVVKVADVHIPPPEEPPASSTGALRERVRELLAWRDDQTKRRCQGYAVQETEDDGSIK